MYVEHVLTDVLSGVPSAGPASQVQELRTWREHYKVIVHWPRSSNNKFSQGLALAAKAAGNKEEALSNMKYIKVNLGFKSKDLKHPIQT